MLCERNSTLQSIVSLNVEPTI